MRVIIVGGGWSGLAAAAELSQHHCDISLFEAGAVLGGRARSVQWQNLTVDNGQHLMLGAYRQMLNLMQQIGLDANDVFSRQPLDLSVLDPAYPPFFISSRGRLTPQLNRLIHLWKSAGFASVTAIWRLQKQLSDMSLDTSMTVADLLRKSRQPQRLIRQLWEPLTLAMLNTPIDEAAAVVFANVLKASLFADHNATELLIPKQPLGDVLPNPLARYLMQRGAQINLNNRVQSLLINNNQISGIIDQAGNPHFADAVILALPPAALAKLLPDNPIYNSTPEYPICTVYLQYAATLKPAQSMIGFSGIMSQWLFDRSVQRPGLMAVVISGPGAHMQLSKTELIQTISQELAERMPGWPAIADDALVIREKRATFACTPDIQKSRPESQTAISNLWLAGDFVYHPFPATLETAIGNGRLCAQQILQIDN